MKTYLPSLITPQNDASDRSQTQSKMSGSSPSLEALASNKIELKDDGQKLLYSWIDTDDFGSMQKEDLLPRLNDLLAVVKNLEHVIHLKDVQLLECNNMLDHVIKLNNELNQKYVLQQKKNRQNLEIIRVLKTQASVGDPSIGDHSDSHSTISSRVDTGNSEKLCREIVDEILSSVLVQEENDSCSDISAGDNAAFWQCKVSHVAMQTELCIVDKSTQVEQGNVSSHVDSFDYRNENMIKRVGKVYSIADKHSTAEEAIHVHNEPSNIASETAISSFAHDMVKDIFLTQLSKSDTLLTKSCTASPRYSFDAIGNFVSPVLPLNCSDDFPPSWCNVNKRLSYENDLSLTVNNETTTWSSNNDDVCSDISRPHTSPGNHENNADVLVVTGEIYKSNSDDTLGIINDDGMTDSDDSDLLSPSSENLMPARPNYVSDCEEEPVTANVGQARNDSSDCNSDCADNVMSSSVKKSSEAVFVEVKSPRDVQHVKSKNNKKSEKRLKHAKTELKESHSKKDVKTEGERLECDKGDTTDDGLQCSGKHMQLQSKPVLLRKNSAKLLDKRSNKYSLSVLSPRNDEELSGCDPLSPGRYLRDHSQCSKTLCPSNKDVVHFSLREVAPAKIPRAGGVLLRKSQDISVGSSPLMNTVPPHTASKLFPLLPLNSGLGCKVCVDDMGEKYAGQTMMKKKKPSGL